MDQNAIQKQQQPRTAMGLIESMKGQIARALPSHLTPDRMARVLLTAIRKNPDLGRCTPESFAGCIMDLSQLGLEPNTPMGLAYLIPRKGACTIMIGYQGYIELARRSGRVRSIYAHVVRQGDDFSYELGLHQTLRHVPKADVKAPVTHAYAVAHLVDADPVFIVLSKSEIEARRRRGASGQNKTTPWDSDYDAMARKTAIRALWPWLPKSAEMAQAAELEDEADRATVTSQPSRAHEGEEGEPRRRSLLADLENEPEEEYEQPENGQPDGSSEEEQNGGEG